MLYDPKWEAKTKPDVFSLESLIAWLETMPADGEYFYGGFQVCLIAKWLEHIDPKSRPGAGHSFMYEVHGVNMNLERFNEIVVSTPRTFGAALERARAAHPAL